MILRPVSYTHLDVYKRQGLQGGDAGGDNVLSNDALLTRLDGKALQGHHIVHTLGEDCLLYTSIALAAVVHQHDVGLALLVKDLGLLAGHALDGIRA